MAWVSARDRSKGLEQRVVMRALFSDLGLARGGRATIKIERRRGKLTVSLTPERDENGP
jgi:hypothetical protein